jgi:hypothetical protein
MLILLLLLLLLLQQVSIAAAISGADVVGLWYALTKLPHRNISNSHKFQAVALGEAAAADNKQQPHVASKHAGARAMTSRHAATAPMNSLPFRCM